MSLQFLRPRRVEKASFTLPATTQTAMFTITGGRVAILQILGEVTTVIQNQANNLKLIHNVGTGTDVDLCAVLNIANDEVGTLYGMTGLHTDALIGAAQFVPAQLREVIIKPGTIDLSTSATNTGATKWMLLYAPLDSGAYVASA